MYGMVNQAIKDLVVQNHGFEKWNAICEDAKIPTDDFEFMTYYPDKITYELVGSASKTLGVSGEKILQLFGRHWVLYTAKEGYGPMMDLFGGDFATCLENLNNLHARMGMTMPHLSPPRFVFSAVGPNHYRLEYHSKREGLSPMVVGLLEGLAEKYKVKAHIEYQEVKESGTKVFTIRVG